MKRQTLLMGVAVMILVGLIGFYMAFLMEENLGNSSNQTTKFVESTNFSTSSDDSIVTAEFDNKSLNLMHEDSQEARFYVDLDQDGSFDIELKDLTRDGNVHRTTEIVTLGGTNYRLYFRYKDSDNESDTTFDGVSNYVSILDNSKKKQKKEIT